MAKMLIDTFNGLVIDGFSVCQVEMTVVYFSLLLKDSFLNW